MTTSPDLGGPGGEVDRAMAPTGRPGSHGRAVVEAADPGSTIVVDRVESNVSAVAVRVGTVPRGRVVEPSGGRA